MHGPVEATTTCAPSKRTEQAERSLTGLADQILGKTCVVIFKYQLLKTNKEVVSVDDQLCPDMTSRPFGRAKNPGDGRGSIKWQWVIAPNASLACLVTSDSVVWPDIRFFAFGSEPPRPDPGSEEIRNSP